MPASINLSDLAWAVPDSPPLFSHLNLSFGPVRTGLVGRNGVGKTALLGLIVGELRPRSGGVSVSGSLDVLRQAVRTKRSLTCSACPPHWRCWRADRGEATDEELADADWTLEARIAATLGRVGLVLPPGARLATPPGGQSTRAGLAALVFSEPDYLLLDEPANNLDHDGRIAVIDLLAGWRSGAIVVSHDREPLETMDAILDLSTLGAARYGGNWSAYRELKALEPAAARRQHADAERRVADVTRGAREAVERQARRSGAGRRKGLEGGTPRIVLGTMKDRREGTAGGNARLAERQREQALASAAAARERIEILQPLTVKLPQTQLPAGKAVLKVEGATVGYEPGRPVLRDLSFSVT